MKIFVALDTNSYKLKDGITPVNLTWKNNTIKDWCAKVKYMPEDIVIGHSLGAAVSLIMAAKNPPKELHLYSPSPIFKETINFLDKKNLRHFGKKRERDVEPIPTVSCPVTIYVGSLEEQMMIATAKEILKRIPHSKFKIIPNTNHSTVISQLLINN